MRESLRARCPSEWTDGGEIFLLVLGGIFVEDLVLVLRGLSSFSFELMKPLLDGNP